MDEEDDLDLDFEIGSDPIHQFLQHKLDEIRLNNEELEAQIKKRKELLEGCVKKVAKEFNENVLSVGGTWKKVLNDKLIVGIQLTNLSKAGFPKDVNVILKWNSSRSLTYKSKLFGQYKLPEPSESNCPKQYEELLSVLENEVGPKTEFVEKEWIRLEEIGGNATMVLVFSLSDFMEKPSHMLCGIVTYSFKEKNCQLELEEFEILVTDFCNEFLTVKGADLMSGGYEAYLSCIVAKDEMEYTIGTQRNFYGSLESMLEFECKFRQCNVLSESKKFFYVDGLAGVINGAFLVVENESDSLYKLTTYTSNTSMLNSLLHYISKNISNIIILPIKYKQTVENRLREELEDESAVPTSTLKQFTKCLENQIEFVENFCEEHLNNISAETIDNVNEIELNVNNEDYQIFRNRLSDLELNADLLFAKMDSTSQEN